MHLSLEKVMKIAEKVGGKEHHMRYLQVPINVMMPEAFVEPWQRAEDKAGVTRNTILLPLCHEYQLNVISS